MEAISRATEGFSAIIKYFINLGEVKLLKGEASEFCRNCLSKWICERKCRLENEVLVKTVNKSGVNPVSGFWIIVFIAKQP